MERHIVSNVPYRCGECPMWDAKDKLFYWSDMLAGSLFCFDPQNGRVFRVAEGRNVSGFTMNEQGGFVCATHQGLFLFDEKQGWTMIADEVEGQALHSNDATADAAGRFIFGTTFYDQTVGDDYARGRLYSVEHNGNIRILDEGFSLPNGIAFSTDNKTIYVTETVSREILAYDYDLLAGTISNRRVAVKISEEDGIPDGMTVDAQGGIWSALWYGGCIVRFGPDGKETIRIPVPSGQTSSMMFGGEGLTDIYVTSAAEVVRLSCAPKGYDFTAPHNGSVFRFTDTGFTGKEENFANIAL